MKQNYKNHVKYYPPHHFIFYPVVLALLVWSLHNYFSGNEQNLMWLAVAAIFIMLGWLSFMLRQHYALTNQNRIVRIELRFRYYVLTGRRLEEIEHKLSFKQLAALRFAGDEELVALINKAIAENLSPDAIKRSIQHWLPDEMRV